MQTIEKQQLSVVVTSPDQNKHNNRYTCICCRIKFESAELQRIHFKTEWHLYNLKRRICSLDPIDLEGFQEIQVANNAQRGDDNDFDASSYVDLNASDLDSPDVSHTTDNEDDWEKIDGNEQFLDEDYDDDEIDDLLARMVSRDTCLFCDKKSTDIRANIDHMDLNHGFFIPEERFLIDLEGLIDYLGFKVGAGATCLWCNKQFTNLHGVRLHMICKNHCKILYDQESAIEEFKNFYDYTTQDQIPLKVPDQLVVVKRRRERRFSDHNRSLVLAGSPSSSSVGKKNKLELANERTMVTRQAKCIKRFNSQRAQNLLKVGQANNKTARARLRHQNPI